MTPRDRMQLRSLVREFLESENLPEDVVRINARDMMLFVQAAEFFFDKTDNPETTTNRNVRLAREVVKRVRGGQHVKPPEGIIKPPPPPPPPPKR